MSEERLARIETDQARILVMLEHLTERVEERIVSDDAWRNKMERIVFGDGNGNPGHHIKLDRLMQDQSRQKWAIRAVGGAAILLVVRALFALIAKAPGA